MYTSRVVRRSLGPLPSRRTLHSTHSAPSALYDKGDRFDFLKSNPRSPKPRKVGVTEIVGAYNAVLFIKRMPW